MFYEKVFLNIYSLFSLNFLRLQMMAQLVLNNMGCVNDQLI